MAGPLAGIKVVELATFIAVPGGAQLLAAQGAEVIKVEDPAVPDPLRVFGSGRNGMSGWFANTSGGKRAISLNLRSDGGRSVMLELLDRADVFAQAFRPGVMDRLGIGPSVVRARNPRIVYLSLSGWGSSGPYADRPAYDAVVQAVAGYTGVQGGQEGPAFMRSFIPDKVTSLTWAQAVTAALFARERSGRGDHVQLSLLDSAVSFLWPDAMMHHTVIGDDIDEQPNIIDGYSVASCRDGHVAVMPLTDDQWGGAMRALGAPELITDSRFADGGARAANFADMIDVVSDLVAPYTRDEVVDLLVAADCPVAPTLSPEEVADDPQVRHSGVVAEIDHPTVGRMRAVKPAATFDHHRPEVTAAPALGQHTDEILTELGHDAATISSLRETGAVA